MWKRTPKAVLHDRDSVISFGKYKGQTVQEVMNDDPDYLIWAYENIVEFDLDAQVLDEIVDNSKPKDYPLEGFDLGWINEVPY